MPLVFANSLYAAQVSLGWDKSADLDAVGYKVYYGTSSRNYSSTIDAGSGTTCTVTGLGDGNTYYFAVTAYDIAGAESPFSNEVSAVTAPGSSMTGQPPAPALISPSGTITTATPTYTWNAVSTSTYYYLWVNDSTGNRIQQWYTAAAVGCGSGTGTCSVTPTTVLYSGPGQWWIQTWNSVGYGPQSSAMSFTVQGATTPGSATLRSPTGGITTQTPTYTWDAVSNSTWYYLWVNDSRGTRIQQWYTAAAVGCGAGTGTCSVTPTTALYSGSGQWWIQTWNSVGYGPWSSAMSFTAP